MGKSGKVKQLEPDGPKLIEAYDCQEWYVRVGWHQFISKFNGFDYQVAIAF